MMPMRRKSRGHTNRSDSTDYEAVFNGFQWHVQRIDGHDHNQINNAIQSAKRAADQALSSATLSWQKASNHGG